MRLITNDLNQDYIEVSIFDDNDEVVAIFKVSKKKDSVGDIYQINTVIREDVYVDGHHWLDTELVSDSKELSIIKAHRNENL